MKWSQLSMTASSSFRMWLSPSLLELQCNYCSLVHFGVYLSHQSRPRISSTGIPELKIYSKRTKNRASIEEIDKDTSDPFLLRDDQPNREVQESLKVLKTAAKTRKVPKDEVLSALSTIKKAELDPLNFAETLGGTKSPGRNWMLIFAAEKQLKDGRYFPLTAVQRFDAEAKRIENGVYLGPLGSLAFEGRFSWKKRILAFIFDRIRIKIGIFKPFEVSLGKNDNREPNAKDPFFIWFYVDEEIAVARGRSGGTAFWCRCRRVATP